LPSRPNPARPDTSDVTTSGNTTIFSARKNYVPVTSNTDSDADTVGWSESGAPCNAVPTTRAPPSAINIHQ
jgi:hypothetical protein